MTHTPQPASAPQLTAAASTQISEIMTREPVTVRADLGIDLLVELLLERNLSRVPVLDEGGRLIGIISKTDIVTDHHLREDTEVDQTGAAGWDRHVHEVSGLVRDVMTSVPFSLPESTSIAEASRRMLAYNVHAVPVTSERGDVIGMVSATDVMAWVAGVLPAEADVRGAASSRGRASARAEPGS